MSVQTSWNFSPSVLIALAAYLAIYLTRWLRVRREYGSSGASWYRLSLFGLGLGLLFAALVSPIDRLSEEAAFVHMIQHILLLDLAPILIILSMTKLILRPVARALLSLERSLGPFAHPAFAVLLYCTAMSIWHIPVAYDSALDSPIVHLFEHVCFISAGFLYWWHLLSPIRSRFRFGGMGPVLYMVSSKMILGLLGIVLAFSPEALYGYRSQPGIFGLSDIADQHIAGLIMALEQSVVMGVALVVLFVRMLADEERRAEREERYEE